MSAAKLLLERDGETPKTLSVEGEAWLGRGDGCVIRLDDRAVSRKHALVRRTEEGVQIEAKSEFAPISVNGKECTRAVLKEGDVVEIGPYRLKLQAEKKAAAAATMEPAFSSIMAPVAPSPGPSLPTSPLIPEGSFVMEATAAMPMETAAPEPVEAANPVEPIAAQESPMLDIGAPGSEAPLGVESPAMSEAMPVDLGIAQPVAGSEPTTTSAMDDGRTRVQQSPIEVKLIFPLGLANHDVYEITKDQITIGRGKSCDIVLDDKKSSRKNTIIRREGRRFFVKDLDSANGTYVNGSAVKEVELSGDDKIRVGDVEFDFKVTQRNFNDIEKDFMPVPAEDDRPTSTMEMGAADPMANPIMPDMGAIPAFQPGPTGTPGMAGIPGITGTSGGRKSLVERFKEQPKFRQVLILIVIGLGLWWVMEDDEPAPKPAAKVEAKPSAAPGALPGKRTFEQLTPAEQKFVQTQYRLGLDFLKAKEFDKSIFEIQKIFTLLDDYENSREIERYAKEGKRRLEALEEEKRKKEEEERMKAQVAELVASVKKLMDKKDYAAAKEKFADILALDPENAQVAAWQKDIAAWEEEQERLAGEKRIQESINAKAWEIYQSALAMQKAGKYHSAIEEYGHVAEVGANDKKPLALAKKNIAICRAKINDAREPVLAKARELESSGDLAEAYRQYELAARIDPPHPEAHKGMDRIRGILNERAKNLYTEAILAESYSDFVTAKKKFQETLNTAPTGTVYHERAERKLSGYYKAFDVEAAHE